MKQHLIPATGALCLLLGASAVAAEKKKVEELDFSQPYLLLSSNSKKKFQSKVDQAAAAGYRVVAGEESACSVDCLLMKKLPPGSPRCQYRLIWSGGDIDMEKKLNAAAAEGLRLVRYALWASRVGFMAVMEKPRGGGGGFQYKFLGTSRVATVETEMNEAARQGYVLVKLVSSEPPQAIMERRVGSATPGAGATEGQTFPEEGKQYLVLSTTKQTTIEKEVEQATANGSYVVADITGAVANHKVVLEKVSPGVARQYRSFGVKRLAKWQEQMNEAAAQGFRPFPGRAWSLWVKDSADTGQPSEFLLLDACRASSLRNEILDAVGRGYGPVEGELWVLQKPAAERVQSR